MRRRPRMRRSWTAWAGCCSGRVTATRRCRISREAYADDHDGDIAAHLGEVLWPPRPARGRRADVGRGEPGGSRESSAEVNAAAPARVEVTHAAPLLLTVCWALLVGVRDASTRSQACDRPVGPAPGANLQHAQAWQLDGRAAAAVGTQGWQASLDWRQSGADAQVHLAGPFGVGALVIEADAGGTVAQRRAAQRRGAVDAAGAAGLRAAHGQPALLAAGRARTRTQPSNSSATGRIVRSS